MDNEALGKILGMAMAYGVSFFGLLLAYYNYRKRTIKAETIFTPLSLAIFVPSAIFVVGVLAGSVWFALTLPEEAAVVKRALVLPEGSGDGGKIAGIAIPGVILLFSFWVTYMLYRHFTKKIEEGEGP